MEASDRLETVVSAWTEMRRGRIEPLAALLREDVIWQGVLPEQICRNRDEVLGLMARPRGRRLSRLEAEEIGDRVVVSLESPEFPPLEGQPDQHKRSLVFTFDQEKIVRIESAPSRERAFEIARNAA
jgi:hypothetical protein